MGNFQAFQHDIEIYQTTKNYIFDLVPMKLKELVKIKINFQSNNLVEVDKQLQM